MSILNTLEPKEALNRLALADTVEHIKLTATSDASNPANFSDFNVDTIRDLIIQNDSGNDCYITFGTAAVTATNNHMLLESGASIEIARCKFIYFAIINKTAGNNASIRITGIGG